MGDGHDEARRLAEETHRVIKHAAVEGECVDEHEEARRLAERLRRDPHSIVELGVDKQIIRLLESLAAQPPSEASKYGHSDACPKNCDFWNEA